MRPCLAAWPRAATASTPEPCRAPPRCRHPPGLCGAISPCISPPSAHGASTGTSRPGPQRTLPGPPPGAATRPGKPLPGTCARSARQLRLPGSPSSASWSSSPTPSSGRIASGHRKRHPGRLPHPARETAGRLQAQLPVPATQSPRPEKSPIPCFTPGHLTRKLPSCPARRGRSAHLPLQLRDQSAIPRAAFGEDNTPVSSVPSDRRHDVARSPI